MFYKWKYLGDASNIFAIKLVNKVPGIECQTITPKTTTSNTTWSFSPKSWLQFTFYRIPKIMMKIYAINHKICKSTIYVIL